MRPETKKLIQEKQVEFKSIMTGKKTGHMIHARDIRSILKCETDLLQKTCDKRKDEIGYWKHKQTIDWKYIHEIKERIIYRLQCEFKESHDLVQAIIEDHFDRIFEQLANRQKTEEH